MGNKYKKPILFLILACITVIAILAIIKLGSDRTSVKEYQFPLQAEEIESVLAEKKIDWKITDQSPVNDSHNIFTLRNDRNITMGINTQIKDNQRILSMTWFLPSKLTSDETSDFFKNELSRHFELPGTFYGNKKDLDKVLKEMISYYLDEDNYDKGLEWNKRVGNDHLKAQIKPISPNNSNQVITLLIMPDEAYEDYLLYSEELRAQEIAKNFLLDLYTVSSKEVENYESLSNKIVEAMQINDDVLKSLMTYDAYNIFLKNRQNLMFTQACSEGNYTLEVMDIQLSENKNNIENNEAGYNFELQEKYIFKDSTVTTGTSNGLIELDKIGDSWKVTGYRNLSTIIYSEE